MHKLIKKENKHNRNHSLILLTLKKNTIKETENKNFVIILTIKKHSKKINNNFSFINNYLRGRQFRHFFFLQSKSGYRSKPAFLNILLYNITILFNGAALPELLLEK